MSFNLDEQLGIAKVAKEEGINDESPNSSATNIHVPDPIKRQVQQSLNFDEDTDENQDYEQGTQPAISSTKPVIRSPSCGLRKACYESPMDGEANDQRLRNHAHIWPPNGILKDFKEASLFRSSSDSDVGAPSEEENNTESTSPSSASIFNDASPTVGRNEENFDQQSEEERRGALSYHPESISPIVGSSLLRPVSASEVSQLLMVLDPSSVSDSTHIDTSFLRSLSAEGISQQVLFGPNSERDSPPSVASLLLARPTSATEQSQQMLGAGTHRHGSLRTRGSFFRPFFATTGPSPQPSFETQENSGLVETQENSGLVEAQANSAYMNQTMHGVEKNRRSLRRSLSAPVVPMKSKQSNVRSFSV